MDSYNLKGFSSVFSPDFSKKHSSSTRDKGDSL